MNLKSVYIYILFHICYFIAENGSKRGRLKRNKPKTRAVDENENHARSIL